MTRFILALAMLCLAACTTPSFAAEPEAEPEAAPVVAPEDIQAEADPEVKHRLAVLHRAKMENKLADAKIRLLRELHSAKNAGDRAKLRLMLKTLGLDVARKVAKRGGG